MSERFIEYLRSNHLSQSEFARLYKISQPYLNQIIKGTRQAGRSKAKYLEKITGLHWTEFRSED